LQKGTATTPAQILYIDDDPANRTLVSRVLSGYQFQVIEANTGIEGLQIARKNHPDLILMDINMPGLDGHETTTRMRSVPGLQHVPIVAITANITTGAQQMALAAGCDGYIPKPIDIDVFPHQVIAYLEGQRDNISADEKQRYLGKYSQRLVERLENKIMALEEVNRRLQKIDKLKADFITRAAHELRTPITLVNGYARLLNVTARDTGSGHIDSDNIVELSGRIYQSVNRLNEVVNDILNISLIESNEMQLEYDPVNLETVISSALKELAPQKNSRNLKIETEGLGQLPPVPGDAPRLQQVFWNILSNAVKFTPDNGTILVRGWVSPPGGNAENEGLPVPGQPLEQGGVIVMIQDSGIGIDTAEQQEIFGQFYVVDDAAYHSSSKTAYRGGGMGLGLPIARGIVEAHGGRIWVESRGRDLNTLPGTTFYVLLPLDILPS